MSPPRPGGGRPLRLARPEAGAEAPARIAEEQAPTWEATIARRHGRRDYWLRRGLAMVDLMALTAALGLAFGTSLQHRTEDVKWLLPTLPLWLVLFGLYGLYGRDVKRIGQRTLDDVPGLFHALLIGTLGLWAYFRVVAPQKLIAQEVIVFAVATAVLILSLRWLTRHIATSIFGPERALLLGDTPVLPALVRKMRSHPEYALEPIGLVSSGARAGTVAESVPGLPVLATAGETSIAELARLHDIDRVIVSQEEVSDGAMLDLLRECGQSKVKVSVLPRGFEAMGPSMEVDDIEGITVLGLNPLVFSRSSRAAKRAMDVVGATLALVLTLPVMLIAAAAVRLTSRGPVFFRQTRVGRGGRNFTLYKFRTMVQDAESRIEELMAASEDPHWLKLSRDPRVTRVGRVLRLLSIDELPQLWSVLVGRMSLVGPRPLTPAEHDHVDSWGQIRLDLAPGITGLWQVLGRTSIPFEEMIKLDYVYATNWSLWMDISLLIKTIPAVVRRHGAN